MVDLLWTALDHHKSKIPCNLWWPTLRPSEGSMAKATWRQLCSLQLPQDMLLSWASSLPDATAGGRATMTSLWMTSLWMTSLWRWELSGVGKEQGGEEPTSPGGSWAAAASAGSSPGAGERGCGSQRLGSLGFPALGGKEGGNVLWESQLSGKTRPRETKASALTQGRCSRGFTSLPCVRA